MLVFINKPKPFQAGVIMRTLYYSTFFEGMDIYIDGKIDKAALVRYSRVPVYEIKTKVSFDIPILDSNCLVVDPRAEKTIEEFDIAKIRGIIIDFSGEYKDRFQSVRGLGINLLHYEAVSIIYKIFIRKVKENIPPLKNTFDRNSIYIAKKLLLFLDSEFPNPKRLQYILQHVHKKWGVVVGVKEYRLVGNMKEEVVEYFLEFFNRDLRKLYEAKVTYKNGLIRIPILKKNHIEFREFFIDKNRRRVYITRGLYIDEFKVDAIENLQFFF